MSWALALERLRTRRVDFRRARRGYLTAVVIAVTSCSPQNSSGIKAGPPLELAEFRALRDQLYRGTHAAPPSTGPIGQRGKKVWFVAQSLSAGVTTQAADAVRSAQDALGWNVTVFDGKYDNNIIANGIQQAVAARADGIITYAVGCVDVRGALKIAASAGVPVVSAEAFDCNEDGRSNAPLFSSKVEYESGNLRDFMISLGRAQAIWMAVDAARNERGKALVLKEIGTASANVYSQAFIAELARCKWCSSVTIEYVGIELGAPLQAKIQQALIKHPDINYIEVSYDSVVTSSVIPALKAAGRLKSVQVIGGEGSPENVRLVRQGRGQSVGVGIPAGWEGYAAADNLNRIFAKAPIGKSGMGYQLFDATHNLPKDGGYQPPVDYVAAYRKVWRGR